MGPGDLRDVLESLRDHAHPDLLVGLGKSDDAAVYRVSDEVAVVSTVDFFAPIVDDPYLFGAIAAANAMSDVYAMGGEVLFALNLAGFPREMPKAVIAAIFKGGADKVLEAGGVVAGGHTVVDAEPKYGLCVTGRVHPKRVLIKGGLRPGHRLFLSKPRGRGDRRDGLWSPRPCRRDGGSVGRGYRAPPQGHPPPPRGARARREGAVERRHEAQSGVPRGHPGNARPAVAGAGHLERPGRPALRVRDVGRAPLRRGARRRQPRPRRIRAAGRALLG